MRVRLKADSKTEGKNQQPAVLRMISLPIVAFLWEGSHSCDRLETQCGLFRLQKMKNAQDAAANKEAAAARKAAKAAAKAGLPEANGHDEADTSQAAEEQAAGAASEEAAAATNSKGKGKRGAAASGGKSGKRQRK